MNNPLEMTAAYLEGKLNAEQVAAFEAYLREDSERAKAFVRQAMLDSHLTELMHEQNVQDISTDLSSDSKLGLLVEPLVEPASSKNDIELPPIHLDTTALTKQKYVAALSYVLRHTFTPKRIATLATAAVLLLGMVLAIVTLTGPDESQSIAEIPDVTTPPVEAAPINPIVATLTAEHDAQWASASLARGSDLRAGDRLMLIQGLAEITTRRGAVAIIEAPATIDFIDSPNALRLHAGKLVGICETESSKGFLVRTPHMDVTDLGTRFGVDASQTEATEVHVYQGEVEVAHPTADHGTPQRIIQGQALRAEADVKEFVSIQPEYTRFASGLGSYRLPGTGFGVDPRQGDKADPNWQLIAVNGEALPEPIAMPLGTPLSFQDADWYDPAVARPLVISDTTKYQGDKPGVYTLQTRIDIPQSVDLGNQASLRLLYHADDSMQGIIINGQVVAAVQSTETKDRGRQTRLIAVADTALRHGENTVELHLYNQPATPLSLHLEWQIVQPPPTTN
jgi:hypothetical protein